MKFAIWLSLLLACSGKPDTGTDSTSETGTQTGIDSAQPCSPSSDDATVCITVSPETRWEIPSNISGFNLNLANAGIAPWDPRLESALLALTPGSVRWPGGIGYTVDWKTGQVDTDRALRFNNEVSCTSVDDCFDEKDTGVDTRLECLDRPTAREPDGQQCRVSCTSDEDCATNEICLTFENEDGESTGHCATECPEWDDSICASDEDCYKADADRYGCLGDKTEKYLGYQETILGKGFQPLVDTAELVARTGGDLVIHVNATTGSAEEAGDLATYALEKGIEVDLWAIALETFYFRTPAPPTLWTEGEAYAEDLRAYVSAIETAYADFNAALPTSDAPIDVPPISISFSDAENTWQRVWDEGKTSDPEATDNNPGIEDSVHKNGAFFTAVDAHWYPGDPSSSMEEARKAINHQLIYDFDENINNWFLPKASDKTLRPTMVFTEYNIQTTWRSVMAMVHAVEFVSRAAAHGEVSLVAYHSLTEGCMDTLDGHRESAKNAGVYNRYGVLDSAALNSDGTWGTVLDEYDSIPCLGLQLANAVINPATHALATDVQGGVDVDAEDEESKKSAVSAVFAQAFQGPEAYHLLITNRSDTPHTVQLEGLGETGSLYTINGVDNTWRNCGGGETNTEDEVCRPKGDLALDDAVDWNGQAITLSSWGLVRLDIPRTTAKLPTPSNVALSPLSRAALVSWDPVEKASGYEVRWGVNNALHRYVRVDTTSHTLTGLGANVEHHVRVAAVLDDDTGPFSEAAQVTPTRDFLLQDTFDEDKLESSLPDQYGGAEWTVNNGSLAVAATSGVQIRWQDNVGTHLNIQTDFKLDCDCSIENDCPAVGVVGRYTDDDNRIKAYVDERYDTVTKTNACYIIINRQFAGEGETVARSAYIGVPIVDTSGKLPTNPDKTPLFPEIAPIDDGEWHTLRLQMEQNVVRAWLDGRMVAAGLDTTTLGTGAGVTVRTDAMEFDNVQAW